MTTTQMTPTDRMQAAYERAVAEGIQLFLRADGSVYATSSNGRDRYEVTEHTCSCPAGAHDRICKHRAAFVVRKAIREALATQPPTPVVTPAQAAAARARMAAHDPIADAARVAANREARLARMASARRTA